MISSDKPAKHMPAVIIVTGPTASGKSEAAIDLCRQIGGEIVSADSMQIYRGLDIGTAKVSPQQQDEIKHHLIDICEPGEKFSVALYKEAAEMAIGDIISRGRIPVVCGGTGQYLSALTLGISYVPVKVDYQLREKLGQRAINDLPDMWRELSEIDPQSAARISPGDQKRITRALEIYYQTGITRSEHDRRSKINGPAYDFKSFCLNHDRAVLYERINRRVDLMLQKGLLDEVKDLLSLNLPPDSTCLQAIGYKELILHLQGEISLAEAIDKIKQASRRYAKRQLTWFRRMDSLIWLENMTPEDFSEKMQEILSLDN